MILGVDVGTQSLKAVVLGESLELLGQAGIAYQPSFPRPGWAEQDPALWEQALGPAIAGALRAAALPAERIKALGIAGQLDGCIAVDGAGRALGPCLIWMDRRAEAEVRDIDGEALRRTTGVVCDPTHMAAKIRWLKRNLEGPPPKRFHQPVSYLVARLTGAHVLDHGLASTTMLYGLETRDFDPRLLESFGIEAAELPALAEAAALAGELTAEGAALTGLPAGLPVAVGTGDDFSSPLGGGLVAPGRLVCVLGTAEVVGALHPQPLVDPEALVETHGYPAGGYFIENPGWLSGGALTWFRDAFGLSGYGQLDELAAGVPPGAEGLTFLPALSGAMAPEWHAGARGCFYGLTPAHGLAHMARAVLEGCAFAMRDVAERLIGMGMAVDSILLLGGGAKSDLWARIRADLTGLPVERPAVTDTSPLGAAMLAAVAAGLQPDLAAYARLLGGEREMIQPDGTRRAAYDTAYGAYRRLFDSLRPMFEERGGEGRG